MGLDGIFGKLVDSEVEQHLSGGSRTKEPPAGDEWRQRPGGAGK